MKALLVYGNCSFGGVQNLHVQLHQALNALGCQVQFFWFSKGNLVEHLLTESVSHFRDLGHLLALLTRESFDVVHCATWDLDLGLDAVKLLPRAPKLIATVHGTPCPGWYHANCDVLIGCSQACTATQQRTTNLPVKKILSGVDTEHFTPSNAARQRYPIVGWVGRASDLRLKRIDRLANIAKKLVASKIRIWVASSDLPCEVPCESVQRDLVPQCELWKNHSFHDMPNFYHQISASGGPLLLTSDFEGLPLVLAEAQASGCPVVAPELAGVKECVSTDYGGVLYPTDLPADQLADNIIGLIENHTNLASIKN